LPVPERFFPFQFRHPVVGEIIAEGKGIGKIISNAKAHLPGPLHELDAARNRNLDPVRCSVWFGG